MRFSGIAVRVCGCIGAFLSFLPTTTAGVVEDFSDSPFDSWSIAAGPGGGFSPLPDPFVHDVKNGVLEVHYDSSQTTTRLQRPLDESWSESDNFVFGAALTFDSIDAPFNDFMQISFALTNSKTTGSVRAGAFLEDANTFDNLELGYFPNDSDFGGFFVTGTAQGSADGAEHSFEHFSSDSVSFPLPIGEPLIFLGTYSASESTLIFRVIGDGIDLFIEVDTLGDTFGEPAGLFLVDSLSITSYFDGADFTPESTSVIADVSYDAILATRFGDGDGDGDVDLVDFGILQLCFTGPGVTAMPILECAPFDTDADGDVDLLDFAAFQIAYTGQL